MIGSALDFCMSNWIKPEYIYNNNKILNKTCDIFIYNLRSDNDKQVCNNSQNTRFKLKFEFKSLLI